MGIINLKRNICIKAVAIAKLHDDKAGQKYYGFGPVI